MASRRGRLLRDGASTLASTPRGLSTTVPSDARSPRPNRGKTEGVARAEGHLPRREHDSSIDAGRHTPTLWCRGR
eukprot:2294827-Prymnesium_polylepis.1